MLIAAKESAIEDMEKVIKHAHEQIEQRRADLTNQILNQFNKQQHNLVGKQKCIEQDIEVLKKNITNAKILIQTGDLNGLKSISECLNNINKNMESSHLDLGENCLVFDSNEGLDEFNKCLYSLGQINNEGFLPTTIAFRGAEAKVGHKSTITVEVADHQGDTVPLSPGIYSVSITDPTDSELDTLLSTVGDECTVTFTPQVSGLHRISGMFLGQELISEQTHISVSSNNPVTCCNPVYNPVLKFGGHGLGHGSFNEPWGVDIDKRNNCLYVTDSKNKLIQKFTSDGEFLAQFSVAVRGQDYTTCDIALDCHKGLIFCAACSLKGDIFYETNKLLVFNLEGELQNVLELRHPWKPFYVAINVDGDLIMTCRGKKCLIQVDRKGKILSSMGHVKDPGYIAIDVDNNIIVPDIYENCIYILHPDGTVRHKFGSTGSDKGQLEQPYGIATDGEYILVSEYGNSRVQVFRYDGTFVSMIDSSADPLGGACGLAVTADGHVYVVDTYNHCVKKYRYRDMAW